MIHRAEAITYSDRPGWTTETVSHPSVKELSRRLAEMDRHYRPIIYLFVNASEDHCNVLEVMGGEGLFFIERADSNGFWFTAVDPSGSTERIAIWTSDQGNMVLRKYLWTIDDARLIVEHFMETGRPHPHFRWISVKEMELGQEA